ncbi:MAG: hypothetical protein LBV75_02835, partial [Paludibacter sp.]|nr:hypothetical protein [Paludibacter sp.]
MKRKTLRFLLSLVFLVGGIGITTAIVNAIQADPENITSGIEAIITSSTSVECMEDGTNKDITVEFSIKIPTGTADDHDLKNDGSYYLTSLDFSPSLGVASGLVANVV